MTLTDHQVRAIIDELCTQANIRREWRAPKLRERSTGPASLPALAPLVKRYLAIVDPPQTSLVEHDAEAV